MSDTHDETPLMPGIAPAPQRDPDWVTKHGGPVNDREPCGESGCICYGVGPGHADCACGCDCPPDSDDED